jgi:aminoglycoside phosphotransferase (APT) family kinase protein
MPAGAVGDGKQIAVRIDARDARGVDMHPNQLTISRATVRKLVDAQFPEWRDLPVEEFASRGTVNALFRIGGRLAARFPLEPGDVGSTRRWLESEAQAARELLGRTRFHTPEPVALGEPGEGYPLPWSVQTWLPGTAATDEDPGGSVAFAHDVAGPRQVLRDDLDCDDLEWERGKAWAFQ